MNRTNREIRNRFRYKPQMSKYYFRRNQRKYRGSEEDCSSVKTKNIEGNQSSWLIKLVGNINEEQQMQTKGVQQSNDVGLNNQSHCKIANLNDLKQVDNVQLEDHNQILYQPHPQNAQNQQKQQTCNLKENIQLLTGTCSSVYVTRKSSMKNNFDNHDFGGKQNRNKQVKSTFNRKGINFLQKNKQSAQFYNRNTQKKHIAPLKTIIEKSNNLNKTKLQEEKLQEENHNYTINKHTTNKNQNSKERACNSEGKKVRIQTAQKKNKSKILAKNNQLKDDNKDNYVKIQTISDAKQYVIEKPLNKIYTYKERSAYAEYLKSSYAQYLKSSYGQRLKSSGAERIKSSCGEHLKSPYGQCPKSLYTQNQKSPKDTGVQIRKSGRIAKNRGRVGKAKSVADLLIRQYDKPLFPEYTCPSYSHGEVRKQVGRGGIIRNKSRRDDIRQNAECKLKGIQLKEESNVENSKKTTENCVDRNQKQKELEANTEKSKLQNKRRSYGSINKYGLEKGKKAKTSSMQQSVFPCALTPSQQKNKNIWQRGVQIDSSQYVNSLRQKYNGKENIQDNRQKQVNSKSRKSEYLTIDSNLPSRKYEHQNNQIQNSTFKVPKELLPLQRLYRQLQNDYNQPLSPLNLNIQALSQLPYQQRYAVGAIVSKIQYQNQQFTFERFSRQCRRECADELIILKNSYHRQKDSTQNRSIVGKQGVLKNGKIASIQKKKQTPVIVEVQNEDEIDQIPNAITYLPYINSSIKKSQQYSISVSNELLRQKQNGEDEYENILQKLNNRLKRYIECHKLQQTLQLNFTELKKHSY